MTRQQKIGAVVEFITAKEYGETITHREIMDVIHETSITTTYRSIVSSAKKACAEGGKMIENIRRIGYRIVDPDEYTGQSVKCIVSGAKKIDNGVKILSNAPVNKMSQPGLEAYNRVADKVRILQASLAGAKVEIQMLSNRRIHPLALNNN